MGKSVEGLSCEDESFQTTHWSIVLAAGQRSSPEADAALASLIEGYWYPLFGFARRRGYDFADAQDATQAFFAALLERQFLKEVTREGGRFRAFLLKAFRRFMANQKRSMNAQKRGGSKTFRSIDFREGERRYQNEPSHQITPESSFEHQWALTLIERSLESMQAEHAGNEERFEALKSHLGKTSEISYREAASRLGMTEGAFKTSVHRFRQRFGETLRRHIAATVSHPDDVEDELRSLFETLRKGN